jgi:type IV secretory pathway VirB9-like protein
MSGSVYSARSASLGQGVAAWVGFSLVLVGPAWAERTPTLGLLDARVRSVPYEADQVVRLTAQVGYALELVFEPGERFAGLASGDLTGVDFTAQDEHLFLKPRAAGVVTNLTVLTDRRVYRFAYSVLDADGSPRETTHTRSKDRFNSADPSADVPPAGVLWSVRFVYPPKPVVARRTLPRRSR